MCGCKFKNIFSRIFNLLNVVFIFSAFSFSASSSVSFDPVQNNIFFQHIDIESNLPHPVVFDIVQDSDGFIWFATQGGLAKFNGLNAKMYTSSNSESSGLTNQWFLQLFVDSEQRLWALSQAGLHMYLPEQDSFANFTPENTLSLNTDEVSEEELSNNAAKLDFNVIAETGTNKLWLGSETQGLLIFDLQNLTFSSLAGLSNTHKLLNTSAISDIKRSPDGSIWLVTAENGLFRSPDDGITFSRIGSNASGDKKERLVKIDFDSKGNAWVGSTTNGILYFSAQGEYLNHYFSPTCNSEVTDILVDHNDKVWSATRQGICEFNPHSKQFVSHQKDLGRFSSLISNKVNSLSQDLGGVIWAGTASGVSKWNAKLSNFTHIPQRNMFGQMTSASIMSFAQNNNSLFVGTVDAGVNLLDFKKERFTPFNSAVSKNLADLDSSIVTGLLTEQDHGLWVGTYSEGLFFVNLTSLEVDKYAITLTPEETKPENDANKPNINNETISKMIKLSNNNLAIGTYGGGVHIFNVATKQIYPLQISDNAQKEFLSELDVLDVFESRNNNLWIATHSKGLVKFNSKQRNLTTYSNKQSGKQHIPSNQVFSVIETNRGIWVATGDSGIVLLQNNEEQSQIAFDVNKGLKSDFIYSLVEDELGYIWVSHSKGLSRIDQKDFSIKNFGTTHGLQSSDFNSSAYYKASSGRLYFGGSNGFNTFMPSEVPLNSYQPPLKLTKFVHANEEKPIQSMLRADGVLELNYEDTIVDFEVAALDYTRPSNNRYQYMMEGLSSVWSNIGNSNHVSFSYLNDGQYTLRIRGSNNEEVWSEELQIPIEVQPPIWKTIYAKLLYIFGPILIFLQLLRNQRIKHQRQLSHERRLHQLAYFDGLTGLPNRQSFYESLDKFISLAKRGHYKAGVMFIDLDRFKRINDTLGHDYGDLVLQEIAQRLKECVRDSDFVARNYEANTVNNEIARLGGDEFTLFLSHVESTAETTIVTQRIIESLSRPIKIDSYELSVTPSIGIALYPEHGTSVHELMKHADIAMYQAKEDGRRTYKFYSNELNDRALERLQLEEKMRNAVQNNEFVLYYQPQVDIISNEITKAEALIRWISPEMGFISPADFIPIAEESGIIIELGNWILDTACLEAKKWVDAGLSDCRVSVNVSSVQFKQTALIDNVKNALLKSGLPPHLLELELTESAVMSDVDDNIDRLQQFKDMGITIAIDDFGTGYSSLSYLKKFPIDTLKIDRSFIIEIANSENDAAIVKAIMLLAETMELKVVAEGIENTEQLQILSDYRCQYIQGYFFSRPLAYDDFYKFVATEFHQGVVTSALKAQS